MQQIPTPASGGSLSMASRFAARRNCGSIVARLTRFISAAVRSLPSAQICAAWVLQKSRLSRMLILLADEQLEVI